MLLQVDPSARPSIKDIARFPIVKTHIDNVRLPLFPVLFRVPLTLFILLMLRLQLSISQLLLFFIAHTDATTVVIAVTSVITVFADMTSRTRMRAHTHEYINT